MSLLKRLIKRIVGKSLSEMNAQESLKCTFEDEYEEFQERMLRQDKETIYDSAEKISFFEAVHDYIQEEDALTDAAEIRSDTPIEDLWELYLDQEDLYAESFPDIGELLRRSSFAEKGENEECLVIDFTEKAIGKVIDL